MPLVEHAGTSQLWGNLNSAASRTNLTDRCAANLPVGYTARCLLKSPSVRAREHLAGWWYLRNATTNDDQVVGEAASA